eukprot:m.53285 g.53285  ORF g.53285 m.53285 type:complete len:482 (+) comp21738_c1_seq1:57-1502(+)
MGGCTSRAATAAVAEDCRKEIQTMAELVSKSTRYSEDNIVQLETRVAALEAYIQEVMHKRVAARATMFVKETSGVAENIPLEDLNPQSNDENTDFVSDAPIARRKSKGRQKTNYNGVVSPLHTIFDDGSEPAEEHEETVLMLNESPKNSETPCMRAEFQVMGACASLRGFYGVSTNSPTPMGRPQYNRLDIFGKSTLPEMKWVDNGWQLDDGNGSKFYNPTTTHHPPTDGWEIVDCPEASATLPQLVWQGQRPTTPLTPPTTSAESNKQDATTHMSTKDDIDLKSTGSNSVDGSSQDTSRSSSCVEDVLGPPSLSIVSALLLPDVSNTNRRYSQVPSYFGDEFEVSRNKPTSHSLRAYSSKTKVNDSGSSSPFRSSIDSSASGAILHSMSDELESHMDLHSSPLQVNKDYHSMSESGSSNSLGNNPNNIETTLNTTNIGNKNKDSIKQVAARQSIQKVVSPPATSKAALKNAKAKAKQMFS